MNTLRILSAALAIGAVGLPAATADMAKLLQMMADHMLCCGTLAGNPAKHEAPGKVAQVDSGPVAAAPAAAAAEKPAEAKAPAGRDFERVGFELLAAFNYQAPAYDGSPAKEAPKAKAPDQIPDYVRALDKKKIAITGFMLPTKFKDGRVTEFLLMKDQSGCCFGAMPRINEWIIVKMTNGGVPPLMDVPLTFVGTLKVGEIFEEGYLAGVYQLDGEKMLETAS
jgi:hypothetical protein